MTILNPALPLYNIVLNIDIAEKVRGHNYLSLFMYLYLICIEYIWIYVKTVKLSVSHKTVLTEYSFGTMDSETMVCCSIKVAFHFQFRKK